jgi:molecular chaperone Hsp33
LLAATIKFQGLLTLQLQGGGPLRLLVVQCTHSGDLRGLARADSDEITAAPLDQLCREGTLTITIDPGGGQDRYQGIVSLEGGSLATALETYFAQSEQLPTRLHLGADRRTAAGLLLQRVPGETPDVDAWPRIEILGDTLTEVELLTLEARQLIRRLFHEEDVRLFDARPLCFRCACSQKRTVALLRALGQEEIQAILAEQGQISVSCEFCGKRYVFDPVDAAGLFAAVAPPGGSTTRH